MPRSYIHPPVPILDVLDSALKAISADKRFQSVENGHYDISWCQPRKTKGDEAPERYRITIECMFVPEVENAD